MDVGVIGLGVMGKNLCLNIKDRGYSVSVYNRTYSRTVEFCSGSDFVGSEDLEQFVDSLKRPRKILVLVKADALDEVLGALEKVLKPEDMVLDCGNSHYLETRFRVEKYSGKYHFAGVGISGGEEGARHGPSVMVGGSSHMWREMEEILKSVAAEGEMGKCCKYFGEDGAGHFVKMVHNGIEYGVMQLLVEVYKLLDHRGYTNEKIADLFEKWKNERNGGYLVEICARIFKKKENGKYLIDEIEDIANQKGTGTWTSMAALDMRIPLPIITSAVFARNSSTLKHLRLDLSQKIKSLHTESKITEEEIENGFFFAQACTYWEGLMLIRQASIKYHWNIKLEDVIDVWTQGCIIRSNFLPTLKTILTEEGQTHLISIWNTNLSVLAKIVNYSNENSIAVPTLSAVLTASHEMSERKSGANLIQAMRDYFGAHGVKRNGNENTEHLKWE